MKVFVFSGQDFKDLVMELIDLKWLGEYGGWVWSDVSVIAACTEGMGLDPKKVSALCEGDDTKIVLVEGHLTGMAVQWQSPDKKTILFSVSGYVQSRKNVPGMIRRIEAFTTAEIACIDPNCACRQGYNGVGVDLCSNCQEELVSKGMLDNAVRLLSVSSLEKEREKSESYYSKHIGNAIKDFGLFSDHPAVLVRSSSFVIDSITATNSPVRIWLGKVCSQIEEEKNGIKRRYRSSWTRSSTMPPFLIASRRWNSWTPNQPNKEESKVLHFKTGGGYFFSDGETNIALDPGYGFLDMLYEHGFSVIDIDCVIVSHDHPDHLAEFQNILGLRHNYKNDCLNPLKILLNQSSYYLLSRISKYYFSLLQDAKAELIVPGFKTKIGNIEIETMEMYHDEIYSYVDHPAIKEEIDTEVGPSRALGFRFGFTSYDGFPFKLVMPGDTSFPTTEEHWRKLLDFYGGADIAAIHLGSLETAWRNEEILGSSIRYRENGHLGLNGAIQMIKLLRPKVAVLTEFGEELDANDLRMSIVEIIKEALVSSPTKVVPSDISLFIVFKGGQLLCRCKCGHYVPVSLVNATCNAEKTIVYDYAAGCQSKLSHIKDEDVFPHLFSNMNYQI